MDVFVYSDRRSVLQNGHLLRPGAQSPARCLDRGR